MTWLDVLTLLKQTGGDIDKVDPTRLEAATRRGPGDAETQITIARCEYDRQARKEGTNGQTRWEFG